MLFDGKVCVVTGGTRGIGRAVSLEFARQGAHVIATCLNESPDLSWVDQEDCGARIEVMPFDVSDSSAVRASLMSVKKRFGALDVVVNNAGIERNELIGMIDEFAMRRTFEINVFGTIIMTQYAARIMRQLKTSGSIVNVSSVVGLKGNAGQAVYSASKGAVISFTKSAAKELALYGIRVNAVAPGVTETEMALQARSDLIEQRARSTALQRLAKPEEVAQACAFLASENASYITGHILSVDGGAMM